MDCPICGEPLTRSQKDPNYYLCYHCRKKFKVRTKTASQTYSNIPPKEVREKREQKMRQAYDEMLSAGSQYDHEEHEKPLSKAPIIILGVAIVLVMGCIAWLLLH